MVISIGSAADMAKIGVEESHPLNGDYLVTNDFALSGQWTPIAPVVMDGGVPILDHKFTGTFDGNGKTISGLFIEDLTDGACCKALFGCIWGGVVKRLKLRGSVTLKNEEGGGMYVGGLACVLAGGGIIEENDIGVDVTGFAYVAPICPFILSGGSIVNNKTSGTVTATVFASGVCTGVADFEATKDVAYIAKNVFVGTMNFTGNDPANYGVGMICFPPVLADPQIYFASDRCYWDYTLSPYTNSYVGEHKTTEELKQQATFVHWNFDTVWKIDAGEYPDLQCFVNVVVPDVEGMTQAAAVAAIEAVGLVVSTATAYNADFAAGLVCQQLPAADTTVAIGSTVDIVVSLGALVPNVVGDYYMAARDLIEAQSLVYASTTANSNTVTPGYIISQTPAAGASVAPGSTITVTISLGAAIGPLLYDMYQVKEALANNSAFRTFCGVSTVSQARARVGYYAVDTTSLPAAFVATGNAWERRCDTVDQTYVQDPEISVTFVDDVSKASTDAAVFAAIAGSVDAILQELESQTTWRIRSWAPDSESTPARSAPQSSTQLVTFTVILTSNEHV